MVFWVYIIIIIIIIVVVIIIILKCPKYPSFHYKLTDKFNSVSLKYTNKSKIKNSGYK